MKISSLSNFLSNSGVIRGLELVFANRDMLGHTAIDLVLLTHGAKIVGMFVIVRIMLFVMALMEHVLALLGILVKSKCNRIFFFTQKHVDIKNTPLQKRDDETTFINIFRCDKKCAEGFYGRSCQYKCRCKNGAR